jgi:hypothetical protein
VSHACCGEPEVSAAWRGEPETSAARRGEPEVSAARLDAVASTAANTLAFAAAPTFALLALWTASAGDRSMLCMAMPEASPLNGMALMYALMSAFHATPWLKALSRR